MRQIPSSSWDTTTNKRHIYRYLDYSNPRIPHGTRPVQCRRIWCIPNFNPHLPYGVRLQNSKYTNNKTFQSTPAWIEISNLSVYFYASGCILQRIVHVIPDIVCKFYICMHCPVIYAISCPILHTIPCKNEIPNPI